MKLTEQLKKIKNKYIIVLLIAGIWILFFDRYTIPNQIQLSTKINQLEQDKNFLQREIERVKYEKHQLSTNLSEMEKYAREKYKMKKENEDVYVIINEKK